MNEQAKVYYEACNDDPALVDKLQALLDSSNRYLERLEVANSSLETKAQQILGFTLAITSIVIPIYIQLGIGNPNKAAPWFVLAIVVLLLGALTLVLSYTVSRTRKYSFPTPNVDEFPIRQLIPDIVAKPLCEQISDELLQLWGNPSRTNSRFGVIKAAKRVNDAKSAGMKWAFGSFILYVCCVYIGTVGAFILTAR